MKTVIITYLLVIYSAMSLLAQPIEPLIASLENFLEKHKIPGGMLTIVKKDSVLFTGGIRYADIENKVN